MTSEISDLQVVHTGVTPFQCDVCGKQCRRKGELEKHQQTQHWPGLQSDLPDPDCSVAGGDTGGTPSRPAPLLSSGPPSRPAPLLSSDPPPRPAPAQVLTTSLPPRSAPLLLTQLDPDAMRQADMLKDLTGQQSLASMKLPTLILPH